MKKLYSLLVCLLFLLNASSQVGELDPTFGTNGIQKTAIYSNYWDESGYQVLTTANGSFLVVFQVASSSIYNQTTYIVIARYLQNGVIDPSYGNNGYSAPLLISSATAALQGDKMVMAGIGGQGYMLARYSSEGLLDSSFSEDGLVVTDFIYQHILPSVAVQDDKILIAGGARSPGGNGSDFALARYTSTGILDTEFSEDGVVTTDLHSDNDVATAVAFSEDRIFVAGHTVNSSTTDKDLALACYTLEGLLDSTFSKDGIVTTDINHSDDFVNALAIQENKIIVAGSTFNSSNSTRDFAVARYTHDGLLDATFSEDGIVTTDFNNSSDFAVSIAVQQSKIVVAGDGGIAQYTITGVLDTSFNEDGLVNTGGKAVVFQGDKILIAGSTYIQLSRDYIVTRYTAHGFPDSSFGESGILAGYFPSSATTFISIAVQGDKVVAAGNIVNAGYGGFEDMLNPNRNEDYALVRYTSAGLLDSTFDEDGVVTTELPDSRDITQSVAIHNDTNIVVAGYTPRSHGSSHMSLAFYTSKGLFGGVATTAVYPANNFAKTVITQNDKIVVAGSFFNTEAGHWEFTVLRYNSGGAPDFSFGQGGIVTTDFGGLSARAESVVLQGDKIVAAGNGGTDLAIARYNTDGSLDSTFSEDGVIATDFAGFANTYASSVAVQNDNIVVGGAASNSGEPSVKLIARYLSNGLLDSTFNEDGIVTIGFGETSDIVQSIVIQDDKIIVAGPTWIARYNIDGSLDSSFSEDGVQKTTNVENPFTLAEIALHGNRLYAVGAVDEPRILGSFGVVAAYRLEGSVALSCPADKIQQSDTGLCTALVNDIDPVLTPYESNTLITHSYTGATIGSGTGTASGSTFNSGVTTVTYTLAADTSKTCSFTVQVEPRKEICNGVDDNCDGQVDEGCPTLTLSIEDASVSESQWLALVTVRLSGHSDKWVFVHYSTKDRTAVHAKDYIPVSGPLLFIPGFNTVAKVLVPIVPDHEAEVTEQFEIHLKNAANAVIKRGVGVVNIRDDDGYTKWFNKPGSLRIKASPNPTWNAFTVEVEGMDYISPVTVTAYDVSGRLLEVRRDLRIGQSIQLGDRYGAGTYIIQASQGQYKAQTSVIKSVK